jgi:catecholate siderophore receptor
MRPPALTASLVFAILILPLLGWAQGSETRLDLRIPAQDLKSSLRVVARRFDCNIIFSEADVSGHMGPPLSGMYTAESAYEALLTGTPLVADLSERGTIVIRPRGNSSAKQSAEVHEPTSTAKTVVITGRAGVEDRTRAESSYSISVVPQERVRESGASSVADSIRTTPGFWVENSGGEASANVRARGIPVDGFASVQVAEDGIPIQHDPGLGYLNADQSLRLDETIREIQVVRGGPSSIFSSNAPGGLINYITRKPGPERQGLLKLTLGDDGLYRTDVWLGGPLWNGWRGTFSGFYRIEAGVRDPGYNFNSGGQFRVSVGHDVGTGTLDVDYKRIGDHVGFYTDIPLRIDGNRVRSLPGLNADTGLLIGPETENVRVRSLTGQSLLNLSNGTAVMLDQATAHLVQQVDEWRIENHLRLRATHQERVGLFPLSVQTGPVRLSQLLPQAQTFAPQVASLQFRYVDSPNTVFNGTANGNGLELDADIRQISIHEQELMDDLRLSRKLRIAGQTHDVSVGLYLMSAHETFSRYAAIALTDVRNHSRLLNLVGLDSGGAITGVLTENGIIRDGAEFQDGAGNQQTRALYAADEWQINESLRLDLGSRVEMMHTAGQSEGTDTVNLGQTNTLSDKSYLTGNGVFRAFDRTFLWPTWTIGANWQLSARSGLFARITAAARLPSIGDFITNPTSNPVVNRTGMYELGIKFSASRLETYATLFDTEYHNYGVTQAVYDRGTTAISLQNYYGNTRDYGIELDSSLHLAKHLDLAFGATLQRPVYTALQYTAQSGNSLVNLDYNGNQLIRVPKISLSASPAVRLFNDRLRAEISVEHYGSRYADEANQQKLPPYTVISANARLRLSSKLTFYITSYNLTNTIGLTEGNPNSGEILTSQAGAPVFVARPILGRSAKISLLYSF